MHLSFQNGCGRIEVMAVSRKGMGRGGARPGAGRKRIVQDPERIAVDLEKPDLDALRELATNRDTSVADLIRRAVSQYLKRARRV
jgi:hypothetical protein